MATTMSASHCAIPQSLNSPSDTKRRGPIRRAALTGAAIVFGLLPIAPLSLAHAAGHALAVNSVGVASEPPAPGTGATSRPAAVSDAVDPARWLPANPLIAVRLLEPDRRVGAFREFLTKSGFFESEAYGAIESNPGLMQAKVGLLGVAASAGMDGWTAISQLLGRDAVAGLYPNPSQPDKPGLLVVGLARDADARKKFVDAAASVAGVMKNGKPSPERSTVILGHTVMSIAEELHVALINDALVVANRPSLIEAGIRSFGGAESSFAKDDRYLHLASTAPASALAWATADAPTIIQLAAQGRPVDGLVNNFLGGLMFGGWVKSLIDAKSAIGWIEDSPRGMTLTADVDRGAEFPATHQGFAVTYPALKVDWSKISLPGQIASISMARDWAQLFSDRESILTLSAASEAANFAGTMTTILGNLDFLEDFLPRINAPIRFILTSQNYEAMGYLPSPKFPAFSLVMPLRGGSDPLMTQRLMSGSQMGLSFINIDMAQKQQPGFLLGLAEHRGVQIIKGTYPPPGTPGAGMMSGGSSRPASGSGDDARDADANAGIEGHDGSKAAVASAERGGTVHSRYNVQPVIAVASDHYIVATSMDAMKSIIDAVLDAKPQSEPAGAPEPDAMFIDGSAMSTILSQNREELVVNRMLEEDEDREQATRAIDTLLAAADRIESVSMRSIPSKTGYRASFSITLREGTMASKPESAAKTEQGGTNAGDRK